MRREWCSCAGSYEDGVDDMIHLFSSQRKEVLLLKIALDPLYAVLFNPLREAVVHVRRFRRDQDRCSTNLE